MVPDSSEFGVFSSNQKDQRGHNDDQLQDSAQSSLHHVPSRCVTDDGGIHVYVHPEEELSTQGEESEEEVMVQALNQLDSAYCKCTDGLSLFINYCSQHNAF